MNRSSPDFNLNHLRSFLVIAREGSIVKACRKLHLTQPSLSNQLKQLEEALGYQLFDRTGKRLKINKKGNLVLEYASKIFRLSEEMCFTLTQGQHFEREINIGTLPSLSRSHVQELLDPFWKLKNTFIRVKNAPLKELVEELSLLKLDVILTDTPFRLRSKDLKTFKMHTRDVVVVGHPRFASLKKNFPHSVEGVPFVMPSPSDSLSEGIESFFQKKNKMTLDIHGEYDDVSLLRIAAEGGRCLTALPRNVVEESLRSKKLVSLGKLPFQSTMWVTFRANRKNENVIQEILQSNRKNSHARP